MMIMKAAMELLKEEYELFSDNYNLNVSHLPAAIIITF